MEMLYLLGLALLAMAFIDRQYVAMQRAMRARVEDNERRDR